MDHYKSTYQCQIFGEIKIEVQPHVRSRIWKIVLFWMLVVLPFYFRNREGNFFRKLRLKVIGDKFWNET